MNFPNLAHRYVPEEDAVEGGILDQIDTKVLAELTEAGIEKVKVSCDFSTTEVPTSYWGTSYGWIFKRAWRYWVATGPGIPPDLAEYFYQTWGKQVRVDGDGYGPSPLEYFRGFAVGHYHIDTQEGLNAFAALLRSIHRGR